MKKILIIEDEKSIADTVTHSVEREGYAAVWRERGLQGLEALKADSFALVVLDVGLPDVNGFELCKSIRAFSGVPVIFLTARDDEIDKIVGLEIGADDYITKPFSPRELAARIKTVLRRGCGQNGTAQPGTPQASANPDAIAQAGMGHTATFKAGMGQAGMLQGGMGQANMHQPGIHQASPSNIAPCGQGGGRGAPDAAPQTAMGRLRIDPEKLLALYDGKKLDLTRYEFRLLALLAEQPGKVYSREAIMRKVWGDDSPSLDRTVDAHIKSLRAKFREADTAADPILTHRGTGYALREDI